MFCDPGDLAIFDRNVHNSVNVILGVDNMPFVEKQIIRRKSGLGEGARSDKKREQRAALGNIFFPELLHHVVLNRCTNDGLKVQMTSGHHAKPENMASTRHQSGSCVNCLPCGVTVLSHVDAATDGAALNDSFEGPRNRVSRNLHIAAKLDLVGMYYALQFCVVD